MKRRRKFFVWLLISVFFCSLLLLSIPSLVLAQTGAIVDGCKMIDDPKNIDKPIKINFSLPGITNDNQEVKNLPCFIIGIYVYLAGAAGILATVMVMYGGVKSVVSFGNPQKVSDAKDVIFAALSGLVLTLGSYVLLNFINPNITALKMPDIESIAELPDYFCDPEKAIPKEEVDGKGLYQCGAIGELNGVECVFNLCLASPGTNKGEIIAEQVCVRGTEETPNAQVYSCMPAQTSCDRINDSNVDLEDNKSCTPYSIKGFGLCLWHDEPWYQVFKTDKCMWHEIIRCLDSTWTQVDCSECDGSGKECPEVVEPGGNAQNAGDWVETECRVNAITPVYYGVKDDPALDTFPAICCKKVEAGGTNIPGTNNPGTIGDLRCEGKPLDNPLYWVP